jgi:hypothetical protein
MAYNFALMPSNIAAAWFCPTFPALQVIGGVDCLTLRTGKVFKHFLEPLGISDFFDAFLCFP